MLWVPKNAERRVAPAAFLSPRDTRESASFFTGTSLDLETAWDNADEKSRDFVSAKRGEIRVQKILDHMGSEELGANLFRITQGKAKAEEMIIMTILQPLAKKAGGLFMCKGNICLKR